MQFIDVLVLVLCATSSTHTMPTDFIADSTIISDLNFSLLPEVEIKDVDLQETAIENTIQGEIGTTEEKIRHPLIQPNEHSAQMDIVNEDIKNYPTGPSIHAANTSLKFKGITYNSLNEIQSKDLEINGRDDLMETESKAARETGEFSSTESQEKWQSTIDQKNEISGYQKTPTEYVEAVKSKNLENIPQTFDKNNVDTSQILRSTTEDTQTPAYESKIIPEIAYTLGQETLPASETNSYSEDHLVFQPQVITASLTPGSYRSDSAISPFLRPQESSTNSYDHRMSQVDKYWQEIEKQKQMYDSQNTYRHSRHSKKMERKLSLEEEPARSADVVCASGYSIHGEKCFQSDDGNLDMSTPLMTLDHKSLPYLPLSDELYVLEQRNFNFPDTSSTVLSENPIHLSMPHWPVRNRDQLSGYPRHPACRLPPKWGVGPEELSGWFYSQTDGRCLWFAYAGHGGNANRFYSRASCEAMCIFDQEDLCRNVFCGYPGSHCVLREDKRCKEYAKSRGKDLDIECPPAQPVCRSRRAFIAPEYDTRLIPIECMEDVDAGGCLAKSPDIRYHYDLKSNTCRSFYFHRCGGNSNRFDSMQSCMNHCAI